MGSSRGQHSGQAIAITWTGLRCIPGGQSTALLYSTPHTSPPAHPTVSVYLGWLCWMMRKPLASSRFITHLMPYSWVVVVGGGGGWEEGGRQR